MPEHEEIIESSPAADAYDTNGSEPSEKSVVEWTDLSQADGDLEITTSDDTEEDPELPLDHVFDILRNQRRRCVLQLLQQADGKVSLSDLAEQIAAWENKKEIKQITSSERKCVYVGLYQCHLPKMDDARVIKFNKPRGTIELGANAEALYPYLEPAEKDVNLDWYRNSLFISLGAAIAFGTGLVISSMTTLPVVDLSVGGLLIACFAYGLTAIMWGRRQE